MPLYVDEDAVLPPLPDDVEEYELSKRTGLPAATPTQKGNKPRRVTVDNRPPVVAAKADKGARKKRHPLAKRVGSPVGALTGPQVGSLKGSGSEDAAAGWSNIPWGAVKRKKWEQRTSTVPPLPLQKYVQLNLAPSM